MDAVVSSPVEPTLSVSSPVTTAQQVDTKIAEDYVDE